MHLCAEQVDIVQPWPLVDRDRDAALAQPRIDSQLDRHAASPEQADGEDVVLESSSTRHVLDEDRLSAPPSSPGMVWYV